MWRQDTENLAQTHLMSYTYYSGMTQTHCGEDWYWGKTVQAGVWNTFEMYVKINSNGEPSPWIRPVKLNHETVHVWHAG
jgi:hypothetical protein